MAALSIDDFRAYRRLCEREWGVKIVEKKTSRFMKALAVILFFNKKFLDFYITTIGRTVYWPNADQIDQYAFSTLYHESQHAYDYSRFPPWFVASYLSPQILTLLVFFAFVAFTGDMGWLVCLGAVTFLVPYPSIFRTHWEMRGTACSMSYQIWTQGRVADGFEDHMIRRFCGSGYYFMWPFRGSVKRKLGAAEAKIRAGDLTEVQSKTYQFLVERGVVTAEAEHG